MNNSLKNITILCVMLASLGIALWVRDVIEDRNNDIEILKPITLLKKAPQNYPKKNEESGKIQIGEKVIVLRIGYGKDFRAWKIRGSINQEGWFIEENDNIKIKM